MTETGLVFLTAASE